MSIITVASPDKISIVMFMSFMKKCLGQEYLVSDCHSLMTEESLTVFIQDTLTRSDKLIFGYYARKKINANPNEAIPGKLLEISDLVVWMNIYSTKWEVIKDPKEISKLYIDRWNYNMEIMNSK